MDIRDKQITRFDQDFESSNLPANGVMSMLGQISSGVNPTGAITSEAYDRKKQDLLDAIMQHKTTRLFNQPIYGDFVDQKTSKNNT